MPDDAHRAPPLARYNAKRDFSATPEPQGRVARRAAKAALRFVIQKHWASRLHYDFRLELDGVMLSWAVPKGPSLDPAHKRMAVRVEDHPVSYNDFEGEIPAGHYGAGRVIVWDRGQWAPEGDPQEGLARGKLAFQLSGEKLGGTWELVRTGRPGERKQEAWLLFKKRDAWAKPSAEYDVITALPDSVMSGPAAETPPPAVPARPARGRKAALPATLSLQLATLATQPPAGGDWIVEHKLDGYRIAVRLHRGRVTLFTRAGNDWTSRLQPLAGALAALKLGPSWLDGEIVVLGEHGAPDFNRLQNAIDNARTQDLVIFLFDAPFLEGRDLRELPLRERRALLQQALDGQITAQVRFSEALPAAPADALAAACRLGLEGVMLKRADAPYVGRRTDSWLKLKCQRRQEFVVIGFTDRTNAPREVGALMLGYHEAGVLKPAGSVGTGWSAQQGRELHAKLTKLRTKQPAVDADLLAPGRWSRRARGSEHWVKPTMVVEVAFGEWTPDGHIRHASFRGVRTDKAPEAIGREQAAAPQPVAAPSRSAVPITHPDRVIDESTGVRKIDLVRYYESVAERMLPHLKQRPVSLVRAPQGIGGPLFFQKHADEPVRGMKALDAALWPGHEALLAVARPEGLVAAAQLNVVEFHTWNATARRLGLPDRVVFDLDPGEGVPWPQMQEAALLTRTMLGELGLRSWLKTSGGKGLHVAVPLTPKLGDDDVKAFAKAVTVHLARTLPQRFVAKSGPRNRVGRIFIDYLRNGEGQTTVAAFSARARPGMGVSMPLDWDQLDELKSAAQWTVRTAREYLSLEAADPWRDYWTARQTIKRWPPEA